MGKMGASFSTIHIHNKQQTKPEQFKKQLYSYFTKNGLIPATEEDAQISG